MRLVKNTQRAPDQNRLAGAIILQDALEALCAGGAHSLALRANKQLRSNRLSKSPNVMGKLGGALVDPAFSLDKSRERLRRNLLL